MSNVMLQLLAVYVSSAIGLFLMFKLDAYQLKYAIQKAYNAQTTAEVLSLYNRQYSIYSLMLGVSFAFTDSSEVPYIRTPSESEAKMLNVWTMVPVVNTFLLFADLVFNACNLFESFFSTNSANSTGHLVR